MKTVSKLITHLKKRGVLTSNPIINAIKKIDRKDFVPEELQDFAYVDEPLPIGGGQTISQPYTVALMLELLQVEEGDKVLDVGSGSGYTTALLGELVGPHGRVIGVEIVPELVTMGKNNVAKYHFPHAEIRQAGDVIGVPEDAPYDKILVSAEAKEIPKDLVNQLRVGGRMVIPIDNDIWKVTKQIDDGLEIEKHEGFAFVPLIGG